MSFSVNKFTKSFCISCILIFIAFSATAQQQNTTDFWNNVRFGGGFGLNFGNDYFSGTIAPSGIYDFNDVFSAGIGLNFSYIKNNNHKTTVLGASLLTFYSPIPQLQLSGEFEESHIKRTLELNGDEFSDNYWSPALYIGLGYVTRNITVGFRYDVLHDKDKSLYLDAITPFIRVYF